MIHLDETCLLNDKFEPARLPDVCAPRRELLNRFHQAAERRMIYVCAPAGYGKTVTTLLWLADTDRKAIWIGLDAYDNGISIFYKLLARGIMSVQPQNQNMADILISPAFSTSPVEHVIQMLSEFYPAEQKFSLVLDDMHLISNEEILKSLPLVLKRLPHSFTVCILTRSEPSYELLDQESREQVSIIRPEELRFTSSEIRGYFQSMGHFLSPEELKNAQALTGGWPIGVNAIAQSGFIDGDAEGQVLENFIKRQIWDRWDHDLKDFCMRTSVLSEMPAALADRLTQRNDSKELLDRLCAENAFVVHLGDDLYRYHHLFLDFLCNMRRDAMPEAEEALFKICAQYFNEQQNHLMSLQYWLKSGDYKGIGPYFYSYVFDESNRVMVENIEYFASFFRDFPDEAFREYPALRISRVWYAYVTGDYESMEIHLDALYKSVPSIALHTPEYMEYVALAYSVDHRENFVSQIKRFGWLGRFIKSFSNGKVTKSIVSFAHNFPYMHRSNRDYCDLLLAGDQIFDKLSNTFGKVLGTEWVYVKPGLMAGFAYERDQLEDALAHATYCNSLLTPENSKEGVFCSLIVLHSICHAMEDTAKAEPVLKDLGELVAKEQYFMPNFEAYKTRLKLWDGSVNAANIWLAQYYVTEDTGHLQLYKLFQYLVTARAYLVRSEAKKAEELLLRIQDFASHYRRPADIAEAEVLHAALLWAQKSRTQAQELLEKALERMQPYGFIRLFAEEGLSILPILRKIYARITKSTYTGPLLPAYVNAVLISTYQVSKKRKGVACHLQEDISIIKLSRQQKRVMELLAQGNSAQQIADMTNLKLPTVKTHLSIAYEKLGVHNAMDAVLKAKELKII